MRKIINPWVNKEGYNCFGCAPGNPIGLHLQFFEQDDEIVSFWQPQSHFQGWVGVLHGGIISTLLDETAGWVVTRKLQAAGMTARLNVTFKQPVRSDETQITIRARIREQSGRLVFINCTLENAHADICAEAEAVYSVMSTEKSQEMGFEKCDVEPELLLSF